MAGLGRPSLQGEDGRLEPTTALPSENDDARTTSHVRPLPSSGVHTYQPQKLSCGEGLGTFADTSRAPGRGYARHGISSSNAAEASFLMPIRRSATFSGRRVEHSRSSRVPINTTTSSLCWCVQQPTVNLWCVLCYTLARSWNYWLGLGKAQIQAGGSGRGDTGGAYARTLSWRHESWSAVIRLALDLVPLARLCFEVRKTGRVVLHGSS